MQRCYTGTHIRAAEQPALDAGRGPALMRTAAWGLAHHSRELIQHDGSVYGARVVGLVGKGNNGADTLWALSFLAARGVAIAAIAIHTAEKYLHTAARDAFLRAGGHFVNRIPRDTAAVIDGVFGTGFSGTFDLPAYLADHDLDIPAGARIIACDIASGVHADTGQIPCGSLVADLTVTFGGLKVGLVAEAGAQHAGELRVVDIGLESQLDAVEDPWWIAQDSDVAVWFGAPAWDAHKYSRGVLGVVAGSPDYPGAAVLVVNAAAATGTGYITLVTRWPQRDRVADHVVAAAPQAVVSDRMPQHATALLVGPGLGDSADRQDAARAAIRQGLAQGVPLLIDASGLDLVEPQMFGTGGPAMILTPHVGEMRRLTQRLIPEYSAETPAAQAAHFARHFGVWVVLKSATTYVFSPTGQRSVHPPRTAELATAGTGDTLAGILGAGLSTLDSDCADNVFGMLTAGVRLHSMAGEYAASNGGVVVSKLADDIRAAKQQGLE